MSWTPFNLQRGRLIAWWDAKALHTLSINSSSQVTTWKSRVNGISLVPYGFFVTRAQSGEIVLGDDGLTTHTSLTLPTSITAVAVMNPVRLPPNPATSPRFLTVRGLAGNDYGSGGRIFAMQDANSPYPWTSYHSGAVFSTTPWTQAYRADAVSNRARSLIVSAFDAGGAYIRVNGVSGPRVTGTVNAFDSPCEFCIGVGTSSNENAWGSVAEVLLIDGVLSVADRTKLETYLAQKWRIMMPYARAPLALPARLGGYGYSSGTLSITARLASTGAIFKLNPRLPAAR